MTELDIHPHEDKIHSVLLKWSSSTLKERALREQDQGPICGVLEYFLCELIPKTNLSGGIWCDGVVELSIRKVRTGGLVLKASATLRTGLLRSKWNCITGALSALTVLCLESEFPM